MEQKVAGILSQLAAHASETNRGGMNRYGINTAKAFGVSNAVLHPMAQKIGKDHAGAAALWQTGWREARILACYVDEKKQVTKAQALDWARDFDSWEIVDHAVKLFVEAGLFHELVPAFVTSNGEFKKRAAFSMMASAAVHLKNEPDQTFLDCLAMIRAASGDDRNFVKKAVNWALRQIGKRSLNLHGPCLSLARELAASDNKTARWIGKDAANELADEKIVVMIGQKTTPQNKRKLLAQAMGSLSTIR